MNNLKDYLNQLKIENIDLIIDKFELYYNLLIEWNNKINLTSITEKEDVEIKHFIDSLTSYNLIEDNSLICDIGAGAGFPSIPLAIVKPNCKFVLIDSLNKRINFLNELIDKLNLKNCVCLHSRVEDYARKNLNKFDYCIARAVAALPTLLEYTIPLLKVKGSLIAYKGSNYQEEIDISNNALNKLNSKIVAKNELTLPNNDKRCLLQIIKNNNCLNIYPRSGNKPRLNPL